MKKRLNYLIFVFFILFSLSSCATYNIRIDSTREWIEGKPFPVQITITKTEKISDVILHYSFNGMSKKTVNMNQNGKYFTYTIPGEEVVPGVLRYNISYTYKDKGKSINTVSVTILTLEQAKQKFTKELGSRISFSPPAQVPINRDTQLIVNVKSHKPSTKVTFYYKTPEQASFQEIQLKNSNGNFTALISKSELQAGYNTYYFRVTEENADVGELEVFVKGRDSSNPFQFVILTLADLKKVIMGEMYKTLSHKIPQNVYATKDLEIILSVNYSPGTFIHEFSKDSISVEIFYKSPSSNFKQSFMSLSKNQFKYIISSMDLKSGYNTYYFKVTDDIKDIGTVTVDYPGSGNLLTYNILTMEEIRKIKTSALYQRISHTPVTEVDGVSDLYLQLKVEDAKAKLAALTN